MIAYDDIYSCDQRRAKRLIAKMRQAARHPPEVAPVTGQTFDVTIYTPVSNLNWTYVDLAAASDSFWRRAVRKAVREARSMDLPRYPSQVSSSGEREGETR